MRLEGCLVWLVTFACTCELARCNHPYCAWYPSNIAVVVLRLSVLKHRRAAQFLGLGFQEGTSVRCKSLNWIPESNGSPFISTQGQMDPLLFNPRVRWIPPELNRWQFLSSTDFNMMTEIPWLFRYLYGWWGHIFENLLPGRNLQFGTRCHLFSGQEAFANFVRGIFCF